ncbi:MAG TPA: YheU family protein [Steroidobacteraceae bacterium]
MRFGRVADGNERNEPASIEVPFTALSPEVLRGLAESVVLREGTDYGERERSFESKVEELLGRLRRGEARILFDFDSQTVDIAASEPGA